MGYAWIVPSHSKIGINIFPAQRGGGSAWFFAQLRRVYHSAFDADRFEAENDQLGYGNPEGLRSGAHWLYFRLGFRPMTAALQRLAARAVGAGARYGRAHRSGAGAHRATRRRRFFCIVIPEIRNFLRHHTPCVMPCVMPRVMPCVSDRNARFRGAFRHPVIPVQPTGESSSHPTTADAPSLPYRRARARPTAARPSRRPPTRPAIHPRPACPSSRSCGTHRPPPRSRP